MKYRFIIPPLIALLLASVSNPGLSAQSLHHLDPKFGSYDHPDAWKKKGYEISYPTVTLRLLEGRGQKPITGDVSLQLHWPARIGSETDYWWDCEKGQGSGTYFPQIPHGEVNFKSPLYIIPTIGQRPICLKIYQADINVTTMKLAYLHKGHNQLTVRLQKPKRPNPLGRTPIPESPAPEPVAFPDNPLPSKPVQWNGNGHYYQVATDSGTAMYETWHTAKRYAESQSYLGEPGYLVTITSSAENDFIWQLAQQTFGRRSISFWAGGSDEADEGTWRWVTGPEAGQMFTYTEWWPGEPNNYNSPPGEDHLMVNWNGPHWNDNKSQASARFIIEYGSDSSIPEKSSAAISVAKGAEKQGKTKVVKQTELSGWWVFDFGMTERQTRDVMQENAGNVIRHQYWDGGVSMDVRMYGREWRASVGWMTEDFQDAVSYILLQSHGPKGIQQYATFEKLNNDILKKLSQKYGDPDFSLQRTVKMTPECNSHILESRWDFSNAQIKSSANWDSQGSRGSDCEHATGNFTINVEYSLKKSGGPEL